MRTIQENTERYMAAMHAVQSGVQLEMSRGSVDTRPKHLRIGVNSALLGLAALASLLIDKGVFTQEEYYEELANQAEKEQERYETRNGVKFG